MDIKPHRVDSVQAGLKALELLMKHLRLAAPEQHQHLHQHVHFTPKQLSRKKDEQLDRAEAGYAVIIALEQEIATATL